MTASRTRRSLLFVPGNQPERLAKAANVAADTLLFDLEDSVGPDQKEQARMDVVNALVSGGHAQERAVRVNPPGTPWFAEDLSACVEAGADAIMIPKAADIDDLHDIATGLPRKDIALLALVETPAGLLAASKLANAAPAVAALCFGHADYCLEMGLADNHSNQPAVAHARAQIAVAAKAAGIDAIDNVSLDIKDEHALRADIALGIQLGFTGKLCIHPRQVDLVNEMYRPSEAQLATARKIIEAWDAALAEGKAVITVDNKMIDAPVAAAQRKILERAE